MIKTNMKKLQKVHPTLQLALATSMLIASIAASRGAEIVEWERVVFTSIYTLPDFFFPFFFVITQFGSIYTLGILMILYVTKRHYHIVLRLLMTGTLAYTASGVAKDLWGRARPFELLPDVVSLDYIVRGPGFPSGHTALATALALTIAHYLPKKYWWVAPSLIISVGLSRIYLGVHVPLDIIGGIAIGWVCYALFRHVRLYDVSFMRKQSAKVKKAKPATSRPRLSGYSK
jgi:glycosyltransferase 2 family protein